MSNKCISQQLGLASLLVATYIDSRYIETFLEILNSVRKLEAILYLLLVHDWKPVRQVFLSVFLNALVNKKLTFRWSDIVCGIFQCLICLDVD